MNLKQKLLTGISIFLLVTFLASVITDNQCWAKDKPGPDILVRNDKNAKRINLVRRNGQTFAGDSYYFLTPFDSKGEKASAGTPITLSTDLADTLVDLSAISLDSDPWSPKLGVQVSKNTANAYVSIRRAKCSSAYINNQGIVFADKAQQVQKDGPYINVTFSDPDNKVVILKGLNCRISNKAGQVFDTNIEKHEILLVKQIPREPLNVELTEQATGKKWTFVLFPKFRSATPGVVLYDIKKTTVGHPGQKEPAYRD